jgi:hypothetical protein
MKINLTHNTTSERKSAQNKAFTLGYGWISGTHKQHRNLKENFMFFDDIPLGKGAKVLTCCNDQKTFLDSKNKEITYAELFTK